MTEKPEMVPARLPFLGIEILQREHQRLQDKADDLFRRKYYDDAQHIRNTAIQLGDEILSLLKHYDGKANSPDGQA